MKGNEISMGNTFFKNYLSIWDLGSETGLGVQANKVGVVKQRIGLVGGTLPPQDMSA